jgi:hypothetical protein
MGTIDPVLHMRRLLEERADLIATADECMDRMQERLAAALRAAKKAERRCAAMKDERRMFIDRIRLLEKENKALRAASCGRPGTDPPSSSLGG